MCGAPVKEEKMRKLSVVLMMGVVIGLFVPAADAALLVYEGFDYAGTTLAGMTGGTGWGTAWADPDFDLNLSDDDVSLNSASFPFVPVGDRVFDSGGGTANRNLSSSFVMNAEGNVMYFSMLMRKDDISAGSWEWLQVGLANGPDTRFKMGIGSNDKFYIEVGDDGKGESSGTATAGTTYFLVGKLVSGTNTQNAYLKVYAPGDVVDASEPGTWTATDTGFTGFNLYLLELSLGSNVVDGAIDEIRVGETWADVAPPVEPVDLLTYEGFDYSGTNLNTQNGGSGWDGAWSDPGFDLNLSDDDTSLESSALLMPAVGARILDSLGGGATRDLGVPVDLTQDGSVTYISVLMRKGSIGSTFQEWLELNLSFNTNVRFLMGIGSDDKFYISVGNSAKSFGAGTASENATYLLVAKIVSGTATDTAYLKVYEPGSNMDVSEPASWTASAAGNTGWSLNKLNLSMGTTVTDGAIDEIRIGKTWESVVLSPSKGTLLIFQ